MYAIDDYLLGAQIMQISSTKKKKRAKGEEDAEKVYTLAAADGELLSVHVAVVCLATNHSISMTWFV